MSDPVRLTIVTGFLGAGKSTWLRHHLRSGVFEGARLVVNEAAATSVDHEILGGDPLSAILAGGCACCERRSELVSLLKHLVLSGCSSETRPPHIVLETSGLADPQAIIAAIREDACLATGLAVGEVVTLVGAPQGLDVLGREALARRQVASADCLIVTKLDVADAETTAQLLARLSAINATAPLFGANRGVEVPLRFAGAEAGAPIAGLPDVEPEPLQTVNLDVAALEWTRFALWLSALVHARGSDILRLKGIVPTPRGRILLQGVQGVLDPPVILPGSVQPSDGTLVIIGRGFAAADLKRSLHGFTRACNPEAKLYRAGDGA